MKDNYDKAIKDFDQVISINPKYVEAYYNRENAKYTLGKYEEARADWQRTLELANKQGNQELVQLIQKNLI